MAGPFDEEPVPGFDSIFSINFEPPLIQLSIFRVVVCSFSSMKKFAGATCCYIYMCVCVCVCVVFPIPRA